MSWHNGSNLENPFAHRGYGAGIAAACAAPCATSTNSLNPSPTWSPTVKAYPSFYGSTPKSEVSSSASMWIASFPASSTASSSSICARPHRRCWTGIWDGALRRNSGSSTARVQVISWQGGRRKPLFSRSQAGCIRGHGANLRGIAQRFLQLISRERHFFCTQQFLQTLEESAFLLADVRGKTRREVSQIGTGQRTNFGSSERCA